MEDLTDNQDSGAGLETNVFLTTWQAVYLLYLLWLIVTSVLCIW